MLKGLRLQGRIVLIGVILILGVSLWIGSEKFLYVKSDHPITPPIDALDEADRLIQTASQNFIYHEFNQEIENYKKAIVCYAKAIKVNPKYFLANYNLGKIFREKGKQGEAIKYFKKINTTSSRAELLECTYFSDNFKNYSNKICY